MSGRSGDVASERACSWPGCDGTGEHRAPKSRDRLDDYHWFCLDHVREYNRNWNYFEGMSDNEFTSMVRSSATWERPTWPLGNVGGTRSENGTGGPWIFVAAHDTANAFRFSPNPGRQHINPPGENARISRLGHEERRALDQLGLDETATLQDVKKRYKQLVKRYHPDANGGCDTDSKTSRKVSAEDRLRDIIQAYSHLVASGLLANPA